MIRVVMGASLGSKGEELHWESLSMEEIATMASTASLLGDTRTFVLSGAFSGAKADEFLALVEGLVQSPHLFIFEEEKLLKKPLDALKKKGIHVDTTEPKKDPALKSAETFNVFAVANAFATRDRKAFWLLLIKATRADVAPEALVGMLHWKVRDLLAKGGGKFTKTELREVSRELVSLYHEAHRGAGALELLLERFALRL